jgi:hypothetical protein
MMVPAPSGLDPLSLRLTWKVTEHHNQKLVLWQFRSGYILCWKCKQALFYVFKQGHVWYKLPWWSKQCSSRCLLYVWCYNFRLRYFSSWNMWHIPSLVLHVETWLTLTQLLFINFIVAFLVLNCKFTVVCHDHYSEMNELRGWGSLARITWVLMISSWNIGYADQQQCHWRKHMCSGCGIDHSNVASGTYNFQCNRSMLTSLFVAYMLYYRLEIRYVYIYMLNVFFSSEIAVQE